VVSCGLAGPGDVAGLREVVSHAGTVATAIVIGARRGFDPPARDSS
jgi:hypothetical protein